MNTKSDAAKILLRLSQIPAPRRLTGAEAVVMAHRRLIRKAIRMGHSLDTLSKELGIPRSTLQRHLNSAGIFWRKPRVRKGTAVKKSLVAISHAKMRTASNV